MDFHSFIKPLSGSIVVLQVVHLRPGVRVSGRIWISEKKNTETVLAAAQYLIMLVFLYFSHLLCVLKNWIGLER